MSNVNGDLDTATGLHGLDGDYPYLVECPTCDGTGKAFATRFSSFLSVCRQCQGLGEVESE